MGVVPLLYSPDAVGCIYCGSDLVPEGVQVYGNVTMGRGVSICGPTDINANASSIVIGPGCDIAAFVTITCADSHRRCIGESKEIDRVPVTIKSQVFIGQGSTILGGCVIEDRCIIGAGVVLPKYTHLPAGSKVSAPRPWVTIEGEGYDLQKTHLKSRGFVVLP